MWNRAFMRLLGLSFMAFFVIGLFWRESTRRAQPARRKPAPRQREDGAGDGAAPTRS